MFTHIAKFSIFLLPLLLLVLVSLSIWSNAETAARVTSFATLLTAMATFIFGAYQISKDERKIEFHFYVLDEPSGQGKSDTKTLLRATNVGEKPIYISTIADPHNKKFPVTVGLMSGGNMQRFLSGLCGRWLADALQLKHDDIFRPQAEESTTGTYPDSRIFELKAGRCLRFFIQNDREHWLDFLRKGKKFYIYDTAEKRYYIPKWQVRRAKKDLGL